MTTTQPNPLPWLDKALLKSKTITATAQSIQNRLIKFIDMEAPMHNYITLDSISEELAKAASEQDDKDKTEKLLFTRARLLYDARTVTPIEKPSTYINRYLRDYVARHMLDRVVEFRVRTTDCFFYTLDNVSRPVFDDLLVLRIGDVIFPLQIPYEPKMRVMHDRYQGFDFLFQERDMGRRISRELSFSQLIEEIEEFYEDYADEYGIRL